MSNRIAAGIVAFVAAMGLAAAAAPTQQPDELDTVFVTGSQPAPRLWKVSKGNHVLWVLAYYNLPPGGSGGTAWQRVEARIGESQEVLYPGVGYAYADVGIPDEAKLAAVKLRAARTSGERPNDNILPDRKTVKDVLPAETYGKWLILRGDYIGRNDDVENQRPAWALMSLRFAAFSSVYHAAFPGNDHRDALDKAVYHATFPWNDYRGSVIGSHYRAFFPGGDQRVAVLNAVYKAAEKRKVRFHKLPDVDRKVIVKNPRSLLTSASNLALPDVECFATGISRLGSMIEWWKAEADAWRLGNLEKLRSLHGEAGLPYDSCVDVETAEGFATDYTGLGFGDSLDTGNVKKLADDLRRDREQAEAQAQANWLAAARAAIARNESTFTVASLHEIFGPDGFIEKLRALGYTIEDPL